MSISKNNKDEIINKEILNDNKNGKKINSKIIPPDGGWGWIIVFSTFMVHFISDGVTYSFGFLDKKFSETFKVSEQASGWVLSILLGVSLCSGPISSYFVNRYGCRTVGIFGSILASISFFISIFARNIYILYLTIGIGSGFGFGLMYVSAIVSVTLYFEKRRSLATGIAVCGSGVGTLTLAPIVEEIVKKLDWKLSLIILASVIILCFIFCSTFKPIKPTVLLDNEQININSEFNETNVSILRFDFEDENETNKNNSANSKYNKVLSKKDDSYHKEGVFLEIDKSVNQKDVNYHDNNSFKTITLSRKNSEKHGFESEKYVTENDENKTSYFNLLIEPIFILFCISNFLTSIGYNVPFNYISRAADEKIKTEYSASLVSIMGISSTIGRITVGFLSDKYPKCRLLFYIICVTVSGFTSAFVYMFGSFILFGSYSAIYGFTSGGYVGLTSVCLVDLVGTEDLANAFGLLLVFQGIPSFIGIPLAGHLIDITNSHDLSFGVSGIMIALSGLMLVIVPMLRKRKNNSKV